VTVGTKRDQERRSALRRSRRSQRRRKERSEPTAELVEETMSESAMMVRPQRTTWNSDVGLALGEVKMFSRTITTPRKAKMTV